MKVKEKFKKAIYRGSGEAYLLLKKYPKIDFSKEIFRSVINTNYYDAQSEGTREQYYYDLVQASLQKKFLIDKLIKALKIKRRDTWAIEQLFNLCAFIANKGNSLARETIYKQYQKKLVDDTPWLGEEAIVRIDGFKGILYLAEYYGKLLVNDPNAYLSTNFLYYYNEKQKTKIIERLKKYSKNNNHIKKYLEEYSRDKKFVYSEKVIFNYDYIKKRINSGKPFFIWPYRRKKLSKTLIRKIANDYVQESKLSNKKKYLSFFRSVKFPLSYKYILDVCKAINSNKSRELEFAIDTLKSFRNLKVRDFALKKLKSSKNPKLYLKLLVNNYNEGDANLIHKIVKTQNTPDKAHSVVWSIVEIYYKNKTKECKKILEFLYDNLACGSHRYDVVKILKMNNVLSEKIRREIKYDSYLKTKKLAS